MDVCRIYLARVCGFMNTNNNDAKSGERPYRVAVIGGAGSWGRRYTDGYAMHPECELFALVDTARERRDAFAAHYDVPQVYDSVTELLEREVPDICTVSLPVSASHDAVIACAEAGVKVITCEKPIAESLEKADEMVRCCEERGVPLFCGSALWEFPFLEEVTQWVREGNIGKLTGAAIPGGLQAQVSGNGCVPLYAFLHLIGTDIEWVEGWTDPPEAAAGEEDCNAYGRLGFAGGLVCEVPSQADAPSPHDCVSLTGSEGKVIVSRRGTICLKGAGNDAYPVFPPFMEGAGTNGRFAGIIGAYIRRYELGGEADCSGRGYRQALEIAIALKLSARDGHACIELPLQDRSHVLNPIPYRMWGGDVTGWEVINQRVPKPLT